jgi:hypothetical protein
MSLTRVYAPAGKGPQAGTHLQDRYGDRPGIWCTGLTRLGVAPVGLTRVDVARGR